MKKSKIKTRKKYERGGPTLKERFDEVNRLLANEEHRNVEVGRQLNRIERQNEQLRRTIDAQASEIAVLQETKMNLIEALNILGRTSRLEVQNRLWNAYDLKPQLIEACSNEKSKDLNNYFDANN